MRAPRLPRPWPPAASTALVVLLITSCKTTAPTTAETVATPQTTRATEFKTDYDALPVTTQKQLAEGLISQGQSMKLVHVALGRPDVIVTTPNAKTITWTYHNYVSPVVSTNRVMKGDPPRLPINNGSPLQDTMDAWNNRLLKHEVPDSPEGNDPTKWEGSIPMKAPTQSWSDYGKYRLNLQMTQRIAKPEGAGSRGYAARKAMTKRAEEEYQEALTIPPIVSPDPIKLDVIFVDQRVSDAIIDDSFSAFSLAPLPLNATAAPGVSTQVPQP